MKKRILYITFTLLLGFVILKLGAKASNQNTCPNGEGWTKVESNVFNEVDGADLYCWKGGSENSNCTGYLYYGEDPSDYPPDGEHVCDLSHFSYHLNSSTPTATANATPTATATSTPEPQPPTATPEATPGASSEPTVNPTATPLSQEQWEEIRKEEGEIFGPSK